MMDNDIIKALECCKKGNKCVGHCPFHNNKHDIDICTSRLSENALDLINRQQAEIERLESEYPCKVKCGNNCEIWAKSLSDYDNLIGDISAEGIKEFAERLNGILKKKRKNEQSLFAKTRYGECILAVVNLVKEMTEGSK